MKSSWHPLRNEDQTLRGYRRTDHGIRLDVSPDGAWTARTFDASLVDSGQAAGPALGMEAADGWLYDLTEGKP